MRIFRSQDDLKTIIGIALGYDSPEISETKRMGRASPDWMDYELGKDQQLIGTYGTSSGSSISSLGFLFYDRICIQKAI